MTGFFSLLALGFALSVSAAPIRVVVWDEQQPAQKQVYTNFLGNHIAEYLKTLPNLSVKSVNLNEPEQGLSDELINNCDVLVWWSHIKNQLVPDAKVKQIVERVKDGKLSLVILHSALTSKVFIQALNERTREDAAKTIAADRKAEFILPKSYKDPLPTDPITPRIEMVTNWPTHTPLALVYLPICEISGWHEDGLTTHVTTMLPEHPIAKGLPKEFKIPRDETYVEPFHVPKPDAVIFQESWDKYEKAFRGGMLWNIGKGKMFYFQPGHETFPVYLQAEPLKVVGNAVEWLGSEVSK